MRFGRSGRCWNFETICAAVRIRCNRMWHDILYYVLLLILLLVGLSINVLTLPGLWLMAAVYGVYGWLTGWNHYVGWPSLIAMAVLATIAEVVELTAGSAGAKKAGARSEEHTSELQSP